MLKIRLTQVAEQQLEDIWFYTLSEWNEDQANQYIGAIEQGIRGLLDFPLLGKARPEINKDMRALQIQKHVIFYRVGAEYIDIIGIFHVRIDIASYFDSLT